MEVETDIAEDAVHSKIFHRKHDVADWNCRLRKHLHNFATHHHLDDFILGNLRRLSRVNILAVAKNGDLICDFEQLTHLVRDVDNAFALCPEFTDDPEQMIDL